MAKIFNSDQLNVKYVSKPGLKGRSGGLLTFARGTGGGSKVEDTAMLVEQVGIQFARQLQRKFEYRRHRLYCRPRRRFAQRRWSVG